MAQFVLDGSTAIRWCLIEQQTAHSLATLDLMPEAQVIVPSIWPLEVANVVSREVNKDSISLGEALDFLARLAQFNIKVAGVATDVSTLFNSARTHRLSAYDATYVDLALETGLPLASEDEKMRKAATRAGVPLLF